MGPLAPYSCLESSPLLEPLAVNLLEVHLWHWFAFGLLVVVLLALDLFVFHRNAHAPSLAESAGWSGFWITLALAFNAFVFWWGYEVHGNFEAGSAFLTGFLVEKALSVDNLFVFLVIFRFFRIPLKYQYRILFWGVLGAIVMRLVFILAGVSLIRAFDWVMPLFGLFLVYTAYKLARSEESEVHPEKNFFLRTARRFLRVTRDDHGQRFFARENGRLSITPLFLVLLVIESTDVLFAVDSVPAILGISQDPFIVFTSNIFAIMGLRALYFLLAGVLDRFRYLHYGLSAVLGFIGVKMIAEFGAEHFGWAGGRVVPTWVSLLVVGSLLAVSIMASLIATRREKARENGGQEPDAADWEAEIEKRVPLD